MAKRARGSTTRPGQRAPLQRGATRPAAGAGVGSPTTAPRPATLTPEEEARAAELEAQILAEERAAETASRGRRERGRRPVEVESVARGGSLAVRAADEYAYVARDIKRITLIGGSLIALLLAIWVVVEATGIARF
ncbi:MAG TPA: hypothetical protein VD763_13035 [Candidatus Saccharimonadales bacterium]|nr:hypothetical protein [Candidatus Saccharimonadales bacterium]